MDKEAKLEYFRLQRIIDELKPIEFDGNEFDFTANSQRRLQIAFNAISNTDGKIAWTTSDNKEVELDEKAIKGIFVAAMNRCNALHAKYAELKAKVNAAKTEEEFDLIVW